jgi:hypothetical protein
MSNAVFAGDTSGSITIQAPAVAGTNTLTLPASTGTVALTNDTSACRAWIYLYDNGSTVTTRGSYNVASVTRNATCDFTINFTTAMPSANYAVTATAGMNTTSMRNVALPWNTTAPTTSAFRIQITVADGSLAANGVLCISVFA